MSDQSSCDFNSAAVMLVVVVVALAVIIHLIPALFLAVWQVLPGIAIVWLILVVLGNMVKKLLD